MLAHPWRCIHSHSKVLKNGTKVAIGRAGRPVVNPGHTNDRFRDEPRKRFGPVASAIVGASVLAIVTVANALWTYETTPGDSGEAAVVWPSDALLVADEHLPTLVMMIHPRCPCTAASLAELTEILDARPELRVYVVARAHGPEDRSSPLVERARAIRGATVVLDDGTIAASFGPLTSGHVLLYDAGRLVFSGGITLARGEVGDNPGRRALEAALDHTNVGATTPIFGCPLERGDTGVAP